MSMIYTCIVRDFNSIAFIVTLHMFSGKDIPNRDCCVHCVSGLIPFQYVVKYNAGLTSTKNVELKCLHFTNCVYTRSIQK